jgi:hypothetical protein
VDNKMNATTPGIALAPGTCIQGDLCIAEL